MMEKPPVSIVPLPAHVIPYAGFFVLPPSASVGWTACDSMDESAKAALEDLAQLLAEYLRPATGFALPVVSGNGTITLCQTGNPAPDENDFLPEQYSLCVTEEGARLSAVSAAGLARAVQTLRQLFPAAVYEKTVQSCDWKVPCVEIEDAPGYRYRGVHLDVSRHFFSVAEVCQFIELLAQHRLNRFHWHLTDDQGWRVEIKKYPRLTEVGSKRACTLIGHHEKYPHRFDNTPYGGFYTQEELRQVVSFAARRHITVIPELDMPGHMSAAIAAYPELGNGRIKDPAVRCTWGIAQEVLNMEESTLQFCKDVWSELFDIFPGKFYHIGGDEAPRYEWQESPRASELMAERGLHNANGLQAWFTAQMAKFFTENGKRLVGWDEILHGADPDVVNTRSCAVMAWRGVEPGTKALNAGYDTILTPNTYTYFDYYQERPTREEPLAIGGLLRLSDVYDWDVLPPGLNPGSGTRILGGQAQVWTEYIPTMKYALYMAYPRTCALAEVLWTPKEKQNFSCFRTRLTAHFERFRSQGVHVKQ